MSYLAKPDTQPHFDGSDMRVMHDMFRREFALMAGLVGGVAAADHDRAQIIGDHMDVVMAILHGHHTREDENIWPLLLDRCTQAAGLVGLMEDQHQQVATLLGQVHEELRIWRNSVTGQSREALVDALDRLTPALNEHLRTEEDRVVPLMAQYITLAEWHAHMGSELAADPEHLQLTFGMLMYEGDPESIEQSIAALPADAGDIIRRLAPLTFAEHSRRVHGTATPPRSTEF